MNISTVDEWVPIYIEHFVLATKPNTVNRLPKDYVYENMAEVLECSVKEAKDIITAMNCDGITGVSYYFRDAAKAREAQKEK